MSAADSRSDGAEVYHTPDAWQSQLASLPDLEALGGVQPSIFLAHGS